MAKLKVLINSKELDTLVLDENQEYFIGRGKDVDLQIRDTSLSRKHVKIYFTSHWNIECLSKYSSFDYNETSTNLIEVMESLEFSFNQYHVVFEIENMMEDHNEPMDFEIEENRQEAISDEPINNDQMIDEDTNVDYSITSPYLTIITSPDSNRQKLDGEEWSLGRSDGCDITIDDTKASRKHCIITKSENQFFITDLGSSNGTYLNQKKMKANKIAPLNSGDQIAIGRVKIEFELINDQIAKQLETLPMVKNSPVSVNAHLNNDSRGLQIRKDGVLAENGAVKMFRPTLKDDKKKKKIMIAAAALILIFSFLFSGEGKKKKEEKNLSSTQEIASPFSKLSSENKNLVIRFYDLAYKYYIQGEYARALNETKKIHRLLPDSGYLDLSVEKDSKELEQLVVAAIELNKQKQEIQRKQDQQKRLIRDVKNMVNKCDRLASPGSSVESAQRCLSTALQLDPGNQQAANIISRLEMQAEQRQANANQAAYRRSLVKKGERLFNKAASLEKKKRILDAISAYDRHIASTFPDPSNLKNKSKNKIKTLSIDLKKRVEALTKQAETEYESKNYKVAIEKLNAALNLDPSTSEAKALLANVSKELNKNMRALYSDSVLEESLGNIETAKSLWRKILKTDVRSGNYYRKATLKINKYEK